MPSTRHIDINGSGVMMVGTLKIPIDATSLKEIQEVIITQERKSYISEMPPVVVTNVPEQISVTNTTSTAAALGPTLVQTNGRQHNQDSIAAEFDAKANTQNEAEVVVEEEVVKEIFIRPSQMKEHHTSNIPTAVGELTSFSEEGEEEEENDDATTTPMKVEPTSFTTVTRTRTAYAAQNHTIISVSSNTTSDDGIDVDESCISCCVLPSPCSYTTTATSGTASLDTSPVSQIEITSHSRGGAADCASALTESVSSTEKDFHVVKIKISPDSELCSEVLVNRQQVADIDSENKSATNSNSSCIVGGVVKKKVTVVNLTSVGVPLNSDNQLQLDISRDISESGSSESMVQKSSNGGTSVTELNVSNPTYLYYMMTSGQFSPSDTLDSGTCSDMDNGGSTTNSSTPPPLPKKVGPKLEMHLKTTKILMKDDHDRNRDHDHHHDHERHRSRSKLHHEHQRAGSLTDSEESESSLSCDSLSLSDGVPSKLSFLPDSLLRDIRDRKFPNLPPTSPANGGCFAAKIDFKYATNDDNNDQLVSERNKTNATKFELNNYRKDNNKSCVLIKEGTYGDKCGSGSIVESMEARKFENDKFYTFHVNEHDFGSLVESEPKSLSDDAFAGFKDIRSPSSATSTIRSSKGTVRGVKNRVRNGIATFLQLQQSNVKNYKEKDLGKVVLYTTSMGIIRETYAKCSNMKQILRTLLVKFEERDVFMSTEYQQEIKERMHSDEIKVPQLFVEGQHIGDAEHVERLNESGELRQLLKPYKSMSSTYTCQTCGGYRLLPCPSCNGSKKSVHRNHFTAEFVALKCMNCDEVGLVKCHNC